MRVFAILLAAILPTLVSAQIADSTFKDYQSFSAYVDEHVKDRKMTELLVTMGGRDEYTKEQMDNIQAQTDRLFPTALDQKTVFHRDDLGGGIYQEARAYWTGKSYMYLYFLLHEREDALIVLQFAFNSSVGKIMEKF